MVVYDVREEATKPLLERGPGWQALLLKRPV